jgi:hypothetical protein
MRIVIRTIFCVLLFCLHSPLHLTAQPQTFYLNPATAGPASQSQMVEITRFIPLSAGNKTVDPSADFYISKQYWIIYYFQERQLFIFSKQGQLQKYLSLKKYGEVALYYDNKEELLKFNVRNKNYTLIPRDLKQIRANPGAKQNQKYFKNYELDLKDSALQIRKTATDPYFIINAKWFYDDFYYLTDLQSDPTPSDTVGYELQILKDYKPVRNFLPYDKRANNVFKYAAARWNLRLYPTDTPEVKYFNRFFNTTIYRLDKDSFTEAYKFILPLENSLPQQYQKSGFRSQADYQNFSNSNGAVMTKIQGFSNLKRYMFIHMGFMRDYQVFLYDKSTARFYKTKMIKADSSQYNIQLLQNGLGVYDNGRYYAMISAQTLLDYQLKDKEKKTTYPPELAAFLKTANKNSNPLIVEYKIKD